MSPSLASAAVNSGSFFSSPLWKRVFSRRRMSPSFIAATAASAFGPMQSSAKATVSPRMALTAGTICLSEYFSSGPPFGRPKWARRITFPPLSAISRMVGATARTRVSSATLPSAMGRLRSTRQRTRLPFTSALSRVRNALMLCLSLSKGDAVEESGIVDDEAVLVHGQVSREAAVDRFVAVEARLQTTVALFVDRRLEGAERHVNHPELDRARPRREPGSTDRQGVGERRAGEVHVDAAVEFRPPAAFAVRPRPATVRDEVQ